MKSLRIGTRGSPLALWQAESVRSRLAGIGVESELVIVRTTGDRDRETSLQVLGGKGVFIKELEDALFEDRADLAVHSMKDVPTELPPGLTISAVCERGEVRDALVSRDGAGLDQLPRGARIGTSSLRRQAQLLNYRPDLQMADIRGNVDTRLSKVGRGDYDATVLAKAGLDRLKLSGRITEVLPVEISLPAAGQGAIGIESRTHDKETLEVLAQINDEETCFAVDAERTVLGGLEGGCQVPIGVWARRELREFVIDACVLATDGSEALRARRSGAIDTLPEMAREVIAELIDRGAARMLRQSGRSSA